MNKVAHILSEEKQARGETRICFSDPDTDERKRREEINGGEKSWQRQYS